MIKGEAERAENCQKLLDEAARGQFQVVTSRLSLVEVTRKRGEGVLKDQRAKIEAFFNHNYILLVELDPRVIEDARDLIWAHNSLRPYDAVHLASALRAKCRVLYTYDDDLLDLNGRMQDLDIIEPVWTGQLPLEPAPRLVALPRGTTEPPSDLDCEK
jgi:predicted nucleic acid-binding protein